ncbi:hypothetical protein B296_00058761 [Ensete ventricosum]|uniref:Uncharacterized protein n=1 Tax=Ensete ventricosum TaxID=4639 RepID=A0A426XKN6_ENSVE|nr:hypothetical protein B296_00058761 [Ensete ventricosum]
MLLVGLFALGHMSRHDRSSQVRPTFESSPIRFLVRSPILNTYKKIIPGDGDPSRLGPYDGQVSMLNTLFGYGGRVFR